MLEVGVSGLTMLTHIESLILFLCADSEADGGFDDGGQQQRRNKGEDGVGERAKDLRADTVLRIRAEDAHGNRPPHAAQTVYGDGAYGIIDLDAVDDDDGKDDDDTTV